MLLIENGLLTDPESKREDKLDILIEGDRIVRIGHRLGAILLKEGLTDCRRINARDCVVAPGLVDVHVHFRDPGFTHKEDIWSGAKAAAKGGFTTVVLMANTRPVVDNEETLEYVLQKGRETGIRIQTCAAITTGMKGDELVPMDGLYEKGAIGFTDDGIPIMDADLVKKAMEEAAKLQVPLSFHEENPAWITNNGINEGEASAHFGIIGSSREAEITMVERDLQLALQTGACVNIQHISTKEAVELVRKAKKQGGNIHAEATPHHFTLNEQALIQYGTLAKMNPPLRTEKDRLAIIQGLKDGTIDLIATDHAPHAAEEKSQPLTKAPSGIIGLETALSLGITQLVDKRLLSMTELLEKMTINPAGMYHLDAGRIKEGGPADLCIFHPGKAWRVEQFESRSSNSPFLNQELKGVVEYTICGGSIVYQNKDLG